MYSLDMSVSKEINCMQYDVKTTIYSIANAAI